MSKLKAYIENLNAQKNVATGAMCQEKAQNDLAVDYSKVPTISEWQEANTVLVVGPGVPTPENNFLLRNADKLIPLADKALNYLKNPGGPPKYKVLLEKTFETIQIPWNKYQEGVKRNYVPGRYMKTYECHRPY